MPRSDNQKARILALHQIFNRYSDESHGLTMADILGKLENQYDIETTRQTVQSDFALLDYVLNISIRESETRPVQYYLEKRTFSTDDLLLLADCVQAAPSVTPERARNILSGLQTLCSTYEAKRLALKLNAAECLYGFDEETQQKIHSIAQTIQDDKPLSFHYPYYEFSKDTCPICLKDHYVVRPLETFVVNNLPFLYAYGGKTSNHMQNHSFLCFRIDVLSDLFIREYPTHNKLKIPNNEPPEEQTNIAPVPLQSIQKEKVSLQCRKDLLTLVYDRFGREIVIDKVDEENFHAIVQTEITPEFFGWLFSMGTGVKLLSPLYATQRMKQWIKEIEGIYY